jgi:hypothetical protein
MKITKLLLLVATATTLIAGIAAANDQTPRADRREARQHARIHQGVKSGELTRREARNLRAGQRHVDRMEARAKSDGKVTPRERARLHRAQNHQSHKIWRKKHNARERES